MTYRIGPLFLATAAFYAPALLHAQFDFKVLGRDVQVHSFGTQGFMYSNDNNYMSMPTSKGSFAYTDGGANISTSITDKFHVGAQLYIRNIGEIGNWHPDIDWAYGSYKFKSWFGVRGGKVKTVFGLYNDTQDLDALHTFALLPQGIYPVDQRGTTIAHSGGDIFGDIAVKHVGTFSYTGYSGFRAPDLNSGYNQAYKNLGINLTSIGGLQTGGDLHLTLPFGATFGASYLTQDITGSGIINATPATPATPYNQNTTANQTTQYYGSYSIKGFQADVEYYRNLRDVNLIRGGIASKSIVDARAWYVSGTYRVTKHLDLGAYRSVYLVDDRKSSTPPAQHEYDTAISGRVNLTNNWYLKVEGHFIDGNPTSPSAVRGFYTDSNPAGLKAGTTLLVIRTGVSF